MTLKQLFEIAQRGGNPTGPACYDRREALRYMDVTSAEYRKQVAKLTRHYR